MRDSDARKLLRWPTSDAYLFIDRFAGTRLTFLRIVNWYELVSAEG